MSEMIACAWCGEAVEDDGTGHSVLCGACAKDRLEAAREDHAAYREELRRESATSRNGRGESCTSNVVPK